MCDKLADELKRALYISNFISNIIRISAKKIFIFERFKRCERKFYDRTTKKKINQREKKKKRLEQLTYAYGAYTGE